MTINDFRIDGTTPDIISRARFEGHAPNLQFVKAAIVIPADISKPVYGDIVGEVKCFSRTKQGFHYRGLFPIRALNQKQAIIKAGVLAGAMAEKLVEVYKDQINCTEYANEGSKAFQDAILRFEAKQMAPLPRDQTLDAILKALEKFG